MLANEGRYGVNHVRILATELSLTISRGSALLHVARRVPEIPRYTISGLHGGMNRQVRGVLCHPINRRCISNGMVPSRIHRDDALA